jgi:hypothetical protein
MTSGALIAVAGVATGLSAARNSYRHGGKPGPVEVTVVIENLAPPGGTFLTPAWVAFHDGSFDSYDGGAPASPELERLAEDGNTGPISDLFLATTPGVDATIVSDTGIPPIAPGETATMTFVLDGRDVANRYFSYASMIIPSNDAFIANGNPTAHRIFNNGGHFMGADFIVTGADVNDAATELNDEAPENTAFFGQMAPDTGQNEDARIHAHPGFKLPGAGGILDDPMFADADFVLHGYDQARITITTDFPGGGSSSGSSGGSGSSSSSGS